MVQLKAVIKNDVSVIKNDDNDIRNDDRSIIRFIIVPFLVN